MIEISYLYYFLSSTLFQQNLKPTTHQKVLSHPRHHQHVPLHRCFYATLFPASNPLTSCHSLSSLFLDCALMSFAFALRTFWCSLHRITFPFLSLVVRICVLSLLCILDKPAIFLSSEALCCSPLSSHSFVDPFLLSLVYYGTSQLGAL